MPTTQPAPRRDATEHLVHLEAPSSGAVGRELHEREQRILLVQPPYVARFITGGWSETRALHQLTLFSSAVGSDPRIRPGDSLRPLRGSEIAEDLPRARGYGVIGRAQLAQEFPKRES